MNTPPTANANPLVQLGQFIQGLLYEIRTLDKAEQLEFQKEVTAMAVSISKAMAMHASANTLVTGHALVLVLLALEKSARAGSTGNA